MNNIEILKEALELLKATHGDISTPATLVRLYEEIKRLRDVK